MLNKCTANEDSIRNRLTVARRQAATLDKQTLVYWGWYSCHHLMQTTVLSISLHMTSIQRKLIEVEDRSCWRVSKPSHGIEGQVEVNGSKEYEENPWMKLVVQLLGTLYLDIFFFNLAESCSVWVNILWTRITSYTSSLCPHISALWSHFNAFSCDKSSCYHHTFNESKVAPGVDIWLGLCRSDGV